MKKILFLLFTLTIFNAVKSQDGSIDSTFGNDGFVSGTIPSLINAAAQQTDGKILGAGGFAASGKSVLRFLNDGTVDSSFGKNGYAALNNPNGGAESMLLLNNQKILVCGGLADINDDTQSFVARFKTDGKLDSSFGINGLTIIPQFSGFQSYGYIELTSDGGIMVGGAGLNNSETLDSQYTVFCRLSADGVFDNSFGNNGYVLNLAAVNLNDFAIQPDGKIVTAGYNFAGGDQQQDFVFSRYDADGILDNSFGNNGNVVMDGNSGEDVPHKVIIQQDGKIVIAGYSAADTYYMTALRLNSDGSLDKTFGENGKVFIRPANQAMEAFNMLQQPDGKFILTGAAYDYQGTNLSGYKFGLCRITNNGVLDSSFAVNGIQITPYKSGCESYASTLQSDGKIVLGGYYYLNGLQRYLMVRYNNDINKKQIIITKIHHWIQHHNGFTWDANNNINSYVVQRSYDGIHFSSIARINTNHQSELNYEDASPLSGTNYYRLQITASIYGEINYSNVLAVSNSEIKISPNPAINSLQIQGLPSNQKIKITLIDFTGNMKLQAFTNHVSYNLNIASLKASNYLLKIETNDNVITKQFVKE